MWTLRQKSHYSVTILTESLIPAKAVGVASISVVSGVRQKGKAGSSESANFANLLIARPESPWVEDVHPQGANSVRPLDVSLPSLIRRFSLTVLRTSA